MKKVITVLALFFAASTAYTQTQWYSLDDDQIYVTDFQLQAGQNKEIKVNASQPVRIGFTSDIAADYDEYQALSDKYGNKVIQFSDMNGGSSMSTISGGTMEFTPKNNEINLQVINLTNKDCKVVIYQRKD